MTCPDCNSEKINVQIVTQKDQRTFGAALLWILGAVFTFGIILLIPLLMGTDNTVKTYAVCQNCGFFLQLKSEDD